MQSLKAGISHQLAHFGPQSAKAFKIAQNNDAYEQAVRKTWSDNPDASEYLLAHTNSLFFAKDETPRKGEGKEIDRYVMGVYIDDPMVRSELNARRELLMFHLMHAGMRFDELRIIPSTMGMRERHLFPQAVERVNEIFGSKPLEQPEWTSHKLDEQAIEDIVSSVEDPNVAAALENAIKAYGDDSSTRGRGNALADLRKLQEEAADIEQEATLRRAICLALEDLDFAETIIEQIRHCTLSLRVNKGSTTPPERRSYWCTLYVDHPELFSKLVNPYVDAVIARARELDLAIITITVRQA